MQQERPIFLQPRHVRVKLPLDFCHADWLSQGAALGRACLRKLPS